MNNKIESSTLSLLALRCPRCHQGRLFTGLYQMPDRCPVCSQTYEPEPGFYYGAMFISFGFSVAIFLISGVVLYYLAGDPDLWVYVTVVTVASLLLNPVVFRYSRALMLYLFGSVRYDPQAGAQPR